MMDQYRKIIFICVFLLALTGCKQEQVTETYEESQNVNRKKIELDYWIWDDEEYYIRKVVDAFHMVQPNIKVNLHTWDNATFDDNIINFAKEGKVDLLGIRGATKVVKYQDEGMLLNVTDYISKSTLDTTAYGNMFYTYTIDDEYYALPTRNTCWVLYYNKEIFDQEGLEYPQQLTWEEYAELAQKLTTGIGGDVKCWGGYFIDWCAQFAGIQRQNYLYDDDISETLEGLKILNRFYNIDKSHVPTEMIQEIGDGYADFFNAGKVAMMPQGEWLAGMLMESARKGKEMIDWDIAPMPIFEGQEPSSTWGQYQFAGITSTCENPDAAFEFLSYLCGEEGARIIMGSGMISAYRDNKAEEIYMRRMGEKNVKVFFESNRMMESPCDKRYERVLESFTEISKAYLNKQITYEETVQKIEQKRKEIYQ